LIYRHDVFGVKSERVVPQFHMFLGSVAGLHKLLMALISLVFGPYLGFLGKVRWIRNMYEFKDEDLPNEEPAPLKNGLYITWLYIMNKSSISCLFTCCKKSKRELKTLKMVAQGAATMSSEFNLKNYIDRNKMSAL